MKRKIIYFNTRILPALVAILLMAIPVKNLTAQTLTAKMQQYAMPGSTPSWIDFKNSTNFRAATIFEDIKDAFGLSSQDTMKIKKIKNDPIGVKHYRYQQYYKHHPVVYGEFIVHEDKNGQVYCANGRLITGISLQDIPAVSEAQALTNALHFMNAPKYLWENSEMEKELRRQTNDPTATYYPKGELVYAPASNRPVYTASEYKLAWKFDIHTAGAEVMSKAVYINALTGSVIHNIDIAMQCAGGTGGSAYNSNVSFSTEANSGTYRSHNDCQATDIYVYNCNGGAAVNTFYTDANNTWSLTSEQSAVQAQWGALMTYNYYIGQHSRASWDGASGDLIAYNNANYSGGSNNACWGCYGNNAIFGQGSTAAATDDWNTDDLMGHEFTHGVTQAEAGLVYSYESGALNESFSDIFGEMVESWAEGNCDYLMGNDRGAIRSYSNPNAFNNPDTYLGPYWATGSGDNGGVHTNSGVQNFWFYLLSEGGTGTNDRGESYSVTGITRFKSRLIAYSALTNWLTSSSQFIDSRMASLHAAFDLYGQCSAEVIAVGDAWHAVGVESLSAQYENEVCGAVASGDFKQAISELRGGYGCVNTINTGASITYYTARDQVNLFPGFSAPEGSKFVAYLEPCSSTMWRTSSNNRDSVILMSDAEKKVESLKVIPATSANKSNEIKKHDTDKMPEGIPTSIAPLSMQPNKEAGKKEAPSMLSEPSKQ